VEIKAAMQEIYTPLAPALLSSDAQSDAPTEKGIATIERGVQGVYERVEQGFARLQEPSRTVDEAKTAWAAAQKEVHTLLERRPLVITLPDMWALGGLLARTTELLESADRSYLRAARRAEIQSFVGSALAIGSAFLGFALAFGGAHRSRKRAEDSQRVTERLAEENARLLAASRIEATTDALTGLANRRKLFTDLNRTLQTALLDDPLLLVLFDLDGFKRYNDTFGHPAGDALLARLGDQLRLAHGSQDGVYRMGGDEFCVLTRLDGRSIEAACEHAAEALRSEGAGFRIGCSYGAVLLPEEAQAAQQALQKADRRMYAQKNRATLRGEVELGPLVQLQLEQSIDLGEHSHHVTELAERTARLLGLGTDDLARVRIAAELHDIGKTAIPDRILEKPGPLDADEWAFMKQHTIIGERILAASSVLSEAAPIVRWSHERFDGTGYPDGLAGQEIPLCSRILAVCDSFDAMRSNRCYAPALSFEEAMSELRRCSGNQFDPVVVDAFIDAYRTHRAELREVAA
jgi:diguanylate cyclase (GGDEF)-like protein/putative nucleotidyltransferase with HDIG domain